MKTYLSRILSLLLLSVVSLTVMTSCNKDNEDEEVTHFYLIQSIDMSRNYENNMTLMLKVTDYTCGTATEMIFHGTEAAAKEMFNSKCDYMETAEFVEGINVEDNTECTFNLIQTLTTAGVEPTVIASRRVIFHTNNITGGE